MAKSGKHQKAPKVAKYNMKNNYMNEADQMRKGSRTSAQQPMKKKRLSK